jgi:hypothetical protein
LKKLKLFNQNAGGSTPEKVKVDLFRVTRKFLYYK